VLKIKEDMLRQQERINTLQARLLELSVSTLPSPAESEHAVLFVDKMDTIAIRNTVNQLVENYTGYCGVFSGDEETGYSFIVGSKHKDCKELAQILRTELGAKCGGNTPMIQGSVIAKKEIIKACLY
jgi:alanyl-tRNA synthetase